IWPANADGVGVEYRVRSRHGKPLGAATGASPVLPLKAPEALEHLERQFATLERARRPQQTATVVHEHRHIHVNAPEPTEEATISEGQPYEPMTPQPLHLRQ